MKPIRRHEVVERPVIAEISAVATGHTPSSVIAAPAEVAGHEDASRYCPICSQRLEARKCKLICSLCGYYMSCADYY